jgi:hypothetical protein
MQWRRHRRLPEDDFQAIMSWIMKLDAKLNRVLRALGEDDEEEVWGDS